VAIELDVDADAVAPDGPLAHPGRARLRLHDLRHTAAASWLAAGLPLISVQRQLRHASIITAQPVYGHLDESFLRGAAERAESLIRTRRTHRTVAKDAETFPRLFPRPASGESAGD
jgi:hypothetical protein